VVDERASLEEWTRAIAAPRPAPAGGSAGALSAALGAAVLEMVAGMTEGRDRYAAARERMAAARARSAELRHELLALAVADAGAFTAFEQALVRPRGTDAERAARDAARRAALLEGARVQRALLERATELAELAATVAAEGLATALGDSAAAGFLAAAVARSSCWAMRADIAEDAERGAWIAEGLGLLARAEAAERAIGLLLERRTG
jgi:formiminotetrahydrofolate cyclodeaminase